MYSKNNIITFVQNTQLSTVQEQYNNNAGISINKKQCTQKIAWCQQI